MRKISGTLAMTLLGSLGRLEGVGHLDRNTAEQHVVGERKAVKKSRKQRLKELQRKAFEGK